MRTRELATTVLSILKPKSVTRSSSPIIVEFSSPNICKPFHVGHFRSTIVGRCIANCVEERRGNVVRLNWLGDWGRQFGILAHEYATSDDVSDDVRATLDSSSPSSSQSSHAVQHLVRLYVRGNAKMGVDDEFSRRVGEVQQELEEGAPGVTQFWRAATRVSMAALDLIYDRLGVRFDEVHRESTFVQSSLSMLQDWRSTIDHGEGCDGIAVSDDKFVVLRKADGSSLYITRDLSALLDRCARWDPQRVLYVVDSEQQSHFEDMKLVLARVGLSKIGDKIEHVPFGRVDGMSTRHGTSIMLDDVLDEGIALCTSLVQRDAHKSGLREGEEQRHAATTLALSGLVVNQLKSKRSSPYKFSWRTSLETRGDSGVYVQLVHARLCSLLRQVWPAVDMAHIVEGDETSCNVLDHDALLAMMHNVYSGDTSLHPLITQLGNYDAMLEGAADERQPCIVVTHMIRLARLTGKTMTAGVRLRQCTKGDQLTARLLLLLAARIQIAKCLRLLGVTPLHRC